MKNWKSVLLNIGVFILCQAILLVMVNKGRENDIELYVQERLHSQEKEFQFILKSFAREAEIVFNEVFAKDEVVRLFAAAKNQHDSRSEHRGRLYQRLLPAYQRLFSLGFRQVHFHFSDGTSFLRLHLPEKFGDSLFPFPFSRISTSGQYGEALCGGDEFAVFTCCLAESSCEEAIARRLTQAVKEINETGEFPFELAISFGIAQLGEKETLEQLMKQADERMYQVKRMKKGKG